MAKDKLSHKEQLAQRKALEKEALAARNKEAKRRKIAMWSTIGVVLAAILTVIAIVVVTTNQNKLDVSDTSPNALSSDGVIMTSLTDAVKGTGYNLDSGKPEDSNTRLKDSKVPHLEIYLDYDCPHCNEFEADNAEYLNSLLEKGKATIEYKPMVVIGSNLSISGANAAACVAEYAPERFLDAQKALFAQHGKASPSVSKAIKSLGIAGDAGEQVSKCVSSKVFSKWVAKATDTAISLKDKNGQKIVEGTPTVLIDGVKYPFDPTQFQNFMTLIVDGGKTPQEVITEANKK